ncbi:MAG: hypothetical protein R3E79_07945 [Caldilineaceae bacterium]
MILEETYTLANGVKILTGVGHLVYQRRRCRWWLRKTRRTLAIATLTPPRRIRMSAAWARAFALRGQTRKRCSTTKLAAEVKDYQAAVAAIDGSLQTMGLDTIDLMIIHSPKPWRKFHEDESFFAGNREAWRALRSLSSRKVAGD